MEPGVSYSIPGMIADVPVYFSATSLFFLLLCPLRLRRKKKPDDPGFFCTVDQLPFSKMIRLTIDSTKATEENAMAKTVPGLLSAFELSLIDCVAA